LPITSTGSQRRIPDQLERPFGRDGIEQPVHQRDHVAFHSAIARGDSAA